MTASRATASADFVEARGRPDFLAGLAAVFLAVVWVEVFGVAIDKNSKGFSQ